MFKPTSAGQETNRPRPASSALCVSWLRRDEWTTSKQNRCASFSNTYTTSANTEEQLRLVTFDVFEQPRRDNVLYAEILLFPYLHTNRGLSALAISCLSKLRSMEPSCQFGVIREKRPESLAHDTMIVNEQNTNGHRPPLLRVGLPPTKVGEEIHRLRDAFGEAFTYTYSMMRNSSHKKGNPSCHYQSMHNYNIHTEGPSWLTARCFVCQRRCCSWGNSFPFSLASCTPLTRIPITTALRLLSMPPARIGPPSIWDSSPGWRSSLRDCSSCTSP